MIDVTVVAYGDREVAARLGAMPDKVRAKLRTAIRSLTVDLLAKVKMNLTGRVLNVRTGLLRRSINMRVDQQEGTSGPGSPDKVISGSVGTNKRTVPYAAIHEFGGKTRPHVIVPRKARVLVFQAGLYGQTIFARKVNHPGSVMPERSYLRSALREMTPKANASIAEAVRAGIKGR